MFKSDGLRNISFIGFQKYFFQHCQLPISEHPTHLLGDRLTTSSQQAWNLYLVLFEIIFQTPDWSRFEYRDILVYEWIRVSIWISSLKYSYGERSRKSKCTTPECNTRRVSVTEKLSFRLQLTTSGNVGVIVCNQWRLRLGVTFENLSSWCIGNICNFYECINI
jgi:hypothetical protein